MTRRLAIFAVTAAMLFLAAPGAIAASTDTDPPTADWVSPASGATVTTRTVALQATATDTGGSELEHVGFSAYWSGSWHSVADISVTGSSATASYTWDLCTAGVPDGDIELGLTAFDTAGNQFTYSDLLPNRHITKQVACTRPTAPANNSLTAVSSTSLQLVWSDNSSNEDGFRVYRWSVPDGQQWVVAGTTTSNTTSFTDTALQPSMHYFYYACAYNAAGEACASDWLDATTPSGMPTAPTNTAATTLSSSSIKFTWADLSNNEDGFRIYRWSVPDGQQWVVAGTTSLNTTIFTDTSLQPSAHYFYYACSFNAVGEACATDWRDATTASGLPTAPTGVSGSPGNGLVQVSWTASSSDGGSPITSYTATASPGGGTCSTSSLTCTVSGLSNGTSYTFTVIARNVRGPGPASSASAAVTPRTVPGIPTAVTGTPANTSVKVAWTAPVATGGSAITGYTATSTPGGKSCTTSTLTCTVTGLTNGTAYTFTVTASNAAGSGPASTASAAVTPRTVPGAPTSVVAKPGTGQAMVSWTAPVSSGGNAITAYTVTSSPGSKTCTSAGVSCWVTGLTNGTPYTFTVRASNAAGTGTSSTASNAVTPSATVVKPTATVTPLALYRTTGAVQVTWGSIPGSAPVTTYDVRYRVSPWNGNFGSWINGLTGTATTIGTLTGAAGSTYCFIVIAHASDGGTSAATAETCTIIPLDDRSFSRSSGWSIGTGGAYFNSTYARSTTSGAKLTRTSVAAKRIAIVASTCATCGKVRVYWGSTLLRTISLYSATSANKKVISVTTFTSARTGTLSLRVYGSGHRVLIDGVIVSRK